MHRWMWLLFLIDTVLLTMSCLYIGICGRQQAEVTAQLLHSDSTIAISMQCDTLFSLTKTLRNTVHCEPALQCAWPLNTGGPAFKSAPSGLTALQVDYVHIRE